MNKIKTNFSIKFPDMDPECLKKKSPIFGNTDPESLTYSQGLITT